MLGLSTRGSRIGERAGSFLAEANRRRVIRTVGVYLVAVWGLSQGAVIVRWDDTDGEKAVIFAEEFCVGRGNDCRIRFYDPLVSRNHARVYHEGGTWGIGDLDSRNGALIDDKQADRSILPEQREVWVNEVGPVLRFELVRPGPETRSAMSAFSPGRMVPTCGAMP